MLKSFAQFDLGRSFLRNKDVWQLIKEKMPVSISLGLWTFLLSYLISMPLGVAKAVREGTRFDTLTTLLVLVGFAIPGFVLGVLLIVLFAGGSFLDWFPLRGLTSDNWASLGWPARITDYLWHLVLPLTCYAIGSFAIVTMLTKNTFVEEIRKQYVLVARAKGLSERRVLYKHVFRNALIPIVTGFPAAFVGAFFAGSLLIETMFSLDGLGLLGYESIVRRDYPVVLGTLYFFTLIGPRGQADRRPAVRGRRPARAVRGGRANERGRERPSSDDGRRRPPPAPRDVAVAQPARLGALQAQPAGLRLAVVFAAHAGRGHVRRAVQQRPAARRALQGRVVLPGLRQPARDALRRRLRHARPTGTTRSSASSSRSPATSRCSRSTPGAPSALDYYARRRRPVAAQPRPLARHRLSRAAT